MKVVHISDLHFPTKIPILSLRGKMVSGYLNYIFRRKSKYPLELRDALFQKIKNLEYDLLILSGDLTNVSHEVEFQEAREILKPILDERVFLVPGNHDRYIDSAIKPVSLFEKYFGDFLGERIDQESFLYCKKIHDFYIIGWDSNFVSGIGNASGIIKEEIINKTINYLKLNQIKKYLLVCHHPLWNPEGQEESSYHKMLNREDVIRKLSDFPPACYFHGHKHSNYFRKPDTEIPFGILNSASSTMLPDRKRMNGFHTLEISDENLVVNRYAFEHLDFRVAELIKY